MSVKSCGLCCIEPSFILLLASVICFCLLPYRQSATSQLGLTFLSTTFESPSHLAQKGIAVQFKYSPHVPNCGPLLQDSFSLSCFYPDEYAILQASERGAFSHRLLVSLPLLCPHFSVLPALNINTFHT